MFAFKAEMIARALSERYPNSFEKWDTVKHTNQQSWMYGAINIQSTRLVMIDT